MFLDSWTHTSSTLKYSQSIFSVIIWGINVKTILCRIYSSLFMSKYVVNFKGQALKQFQIKSIERYMSMYFQVKKQLVLLIIKKIDQTFFFFFNITRWKNMYNISENTF